MHYAVHIIMILGKYYLLPPGWSWNWKRISKKTSVPPKMLSKFSAPPLKGTRVTTVMNKLKSPESESET